MPYDRLSLSKRISFALMLKALILFFLWNAFFSKPQAKNMQMPPQQVKQHLLAPSVDSTYPIKVPHASH